MAPPLVSPRIRTVTPPFPTITRTSTPCHWRVHKSPSSRLTALHATASKQRQFLHKKRLAILFAFLTGWADYLLFIKYRFFSTMMTGNSMWMAAALVESRFRDVAFYITVIASYIAGVATFRRAELEFREKALNGFLAPIVSAFLIWSDVLTWRDNTCRWIPALLLSFAWGIINSVGSEVTGNLIFVVTGAMTRISNMLVDRLSSTAGNIPIPKEGILMSFSVILGFILGAGWSVFLNHVAPQMKAFGSFAAMGVIYGGLFLWLDREELGAWWLKKNGKLLKVDVSTHLKWPKRTLHHIMSCKQPSSDVKE
ncbi:hypothetical protein HJC23_006764 [Cyclotella cryptica]|uniref:DUF1275 domain-containing protein n=1 Tax=Cyclotella cryptica TaxID=29204 RepID=A0ABD3NKC5_9STRA